MWPPPESSRSSVCWPDRVPGVWPTPPALTDFTFMVEGIANTFVTGPDVVRTVTGETASADDLGGARLHTERTGVAHFDAPDERSCFAAVRALLGYLPSSTSVPYRPTTDSAERLCPELAGIVPTNPRQSYDVRAVIRSVTDDGSWFEVAARWACNLVVGFARLDGHVVGVVANQPRVKAGVLDIASAEKSARFVRFCDGFGIPLVTLVDVPGFR
jgi:acetyl-CoA carboxylase carboxyltransferase component